MTSLAGRLIILPLSCLVLGCSIILGGDDEPATATLPAQSAFADQAPTTTAPHRTSNSADPMAPPTTAQPAATAPATPNPQPETGGASTFYEVQPGDTLWDIAIAYGVSLEALRAANAIEDADTIWVGQQLRIPNTSQIATQRPAAPTQLTGPHLEPLAQPSVQSLAEDTPTPSRARGESTPTPALDPLPNQVLLEPMLHDWQKMNNCGPTTVAMALSYYDRLLTQFDTAPALKGGPNDKNVSPSEIASYVRNQGFGARVRVNGDLEVVRQLVGNGIPVIVEQWLDRPDEELTGHYRVVRGYNEATEEFIVNDSFSGPRLRFSYAEFDRLWRPFNRSYIPIYDLAREPLVKAILGDDWGDARMYKRAAEQARTEIEVQGDAYAWFNLGSSLVGLGEYAGAANAFDRAIEIGLPAYMFWYQFGPFEAYNRTHQFQRVLDLSAPLAGIALEELHYQRGVALEGLGRPDAALAEYQRATQLNPRFTRAIEASTRLQGKSGS